MAGFPIQYADRIRTLPPYLFAAIDDMKRKAIEGGMDIINLGIGDPDLPTPEPIIESLRGGRQAIPSIINIHRMMACCRFGRPLRSGINVGLV